MTPEKRRQLLQQVYDTADRPENSAFGGENSSFKSKSAPFLVSLPLSPTRPSAPPPQYARVTRDVPACRRSRFVSLSPIFRIVPCRLRRAGPSLLYDNFARSFAKMRKI